MPALVAKLASLNAVAGFANSAGGGNAPAGSSLPSPPHVTITISHRPAGDEWLELLASGMTYEVTGLIVIGAILQAAIRRSSATT